VSPVTHFFTGWVFGSVVSSNNRERTIITFAAVVPDLDGLGIIPELLTKTSRHPLSWFSQYHHEPAFVAFRGGGFFLRIFSGRSQMDASNACFYQFPSPPCRGSCGITRA
jgi:hypothetical protein